MNFEEILEKAKSGDLSAFEALFTVYCINLEKAVERYIPEDIQSIVSADDIVQETYGKALRNIKSFKPSKEGSFAGWMKMIAIHAVVDRIRKERRLASRLVVPLSTLGNDVMLEPAESPQSQASPSQVAAGTEVAEAVQSAIASLPQDQQAAVLMKFMYGLSTKEIATELDRSEGAIRALTGRATTHLRRLLGNTSLWFNYSDSKK